MNLFNIDLHIAPISDLKHIFSSFGHTIEDKCLSGHADILGRKKDFYKELSRDKWTWFIYNWEFEKFYEDRKEELDKYDGFVVTYPPVFSMLYHKTNKPIIIHIPIRYDHGMHGRADLQKRYAETMQKGVDEGRIFFAANSKYDKRYFEGFTGIPCRHIPSLCEYTGMDYKNGNGQALVYSPTQETANTLGGIWRPTLTRGYKWTHLETYRAMVHLPYQVSTMSIFEHYTANFPMLFPSRKFVKEMFFGGWKGILHHASTMKLHGNKPGSVSKFNGSVDPNDFTSPETVDYWVDGADFYDEEWMPHILYFDSIQQAKDILADKPLLEETSLKMREANKDRKKKVYAMWKKVFEEING